MAITLSPESLSARQRAAFSGLCVQFVDLVLGLKQTEYEAALAEQANEQTSRHPAPITAACNERIASGGVEWSVQLPLGMFFFDWRGAWRFEGTGLGVSDFANTYAGFTLIGSVETQLWDTLRAELTKALRQYGVTDKINEKSSLFREC